jgi:hypothetical protein
MTGQIPLRQFRLRGNCHEEDFDRGFDIVERTVGGAGVYSRWWRQDLGFVPDSLSGPWPLGRNLRAAVPCAGYAGERLNSLYSEELF